MAQMYLPYLMCGYAATVVLMLAGCYAISRTVPGLRGLRLMVAGLLCGLFGLTLLAMRSVAPNWVTVVVAQEAILVCTLLLYCATADIVDVRSSFLPWGVGLLVAALPAMYYFTYIHDGLAARIYICSGCFAVFGGARGVVLFRYREPAGDPSEPISALRSLVSALVWLQVAIVGLQIGRIVLTALHPPREVMHLDVIQSGFSYLNLVLNSGAGFGLTWLSLSMHRRDLHRIAQTDSLTGLLNRRAFEEILNRELDRSNRSDKPLTILLVDIDRFKQVNDTWGHQAGDEVLRRVGDALRLGLRPGDALSRYGGEEFLILLRDTTPEHSQEVAGRLRDRIACLADLPGSVRLTVSIGVAASRGECAADELLRRCDEAMYRSKRGGRNLVTVDGTGGGAAIQASA